MPPARPSWVPRHARSDAARAQGRGEETRRALLEAALRLIGDAGPAAVTHRAVAREAGVSPSATTYYFASKADLLREAYRLEASRYTELVDALVERYGWRAKGLPPLARQQIAAIAGRFLASRLDQERRGRLAQFELTLELARDEVLRGEVLPMRDELRKMMTGLMRRAGSRRPSDHAELLGATVNGLMLESLARGDDPAFVRRARRVATQLMEKLLEE